MELNGSARLLRVFVGESDMVGHTSLHEAIVRAAREKGLAGATVLRGILSYGATSRIRTARLLDLSSDLPVVIEIADEEAKIQAFVPELNALFERAGCGGLVTIEKVEIIRYLHRQGEKAGAGRR